MTERTNTYNIYLGPAFFDTIEARTYDKAISAAEHIARRYSPTNQQPVIVIPEDPRIKRKDR